jgi:ABC-type Fe3+ transport system substrate-binding protein
MKIPPLSFTLLLVCVLAPNLSAQDGKLIAEGKKEGKVVVYGSMESDIFDGIQKSFEKNTGITIEYWRASGASVLERVLSERKAGRPLYDVVINNAGPMEIMLKDGIFANYISPVSKNYAKEFFHPQLGPSYRMSPVGIVYNKSMLTAETAPKSLEDLLKPEFRGKLGFPDPSRGAVAAMWPASLYKLMGKERADNYLRNLGATKPVLVEGVLNAAERVTTGETPMAITYLKYVVVFGQKGAPMDYVRLDKMLGHRHAVQLSNRALHPNAGKALIDFFLGDESIKIMAKSGEFVTRKGIYPPLADAEKIQLVEMDELDTAGFAEKRKEYQKLFLK